MGRCRFCNEDAGFFRSMHPECEPMRSLACEMALGMISLEAAYLLHEISDWELEEALLEGWCDAVDIILSDHVLTDEEYESLTAFEKRFDIPVAVDSLHMPRFNKQRLRWGAAFALNQLNKGMYPGDEGLKLGGLRIPFNFQRAEKLVWMMQDVEYYEQRTRVGRRGHYGGAGFRVTDGVYLHGGDLTAAPLSSMTMINWTWECLRLPPSISTSPATGRSSVSTTIAWYPMNPTMRAYALCGTLCRRIRKHS